jgi:hypothetical protein
MPDEPLQRESPAPEAPMEPLTDSVRHTLLELAEWQNAAERMKERLRESKTYVPVIRDDAPVRSDGTSQ